MSRLLSEQSELVPVHEIRPHERNPNQGDIGAIDQSINSLGFFGGIVVQRSTKKILVGNHRWAAAQNAGMTHLPVFFVDVDDDTAIRILLADNRLAQLASYDDPKLIEILTELAATPYGLEGTGFDGDALDELVAMYETPSVTTLPPAGEPDENVPTAPVDPVTRPGDVWIMGVHRLVCGDSRDLSAIEKLMLPGEQADMMFTDPPYGVSAMGSRTASKKKYGLREIENDDLRGDNLRTFLLDVFALAPLRAGASLYICYDQRTQVEFCSAIAQLQWTRKCTIVWNKNVFGLGNKGYRPKYELIAFGHTGEDYEWLGGNDQADVWDIARPNRQENGDHPTPKPVELVERALKNSSTDGAVVLDLFGGSGSTLIACERTGRAARVIELDPRYCDVIVERWKKLTGREAEREAA